VGRWPTSSWREVGAHVIDGSEYSADSGIGLLQLLISSTRSGWGRWRAPGPRLPASRSVGRDRVRGQREGDGDGRREATYA
jgi:hypothetical protein